MIMQGISCCILVSRVALSNPTPSRIGVIKSEMTRSGAGPSARRSNPGAGSSPTARPGSVPSVPMAAASAVHPGRRLEFS